MDRYILTGGDNGYCCRCGGLCDRVLLQVNDKDKTYKVIGDDICLGKYCWNSHMLYDQKRVIKRDVWVENNKIKRGLFVMSLEDAVACKRPHEHGIKVVVKNNKYGKDGEFGDKLDHYTYIK